MRIFCPAIAVRPFCDLIHYQPVPKGTEQAPHTCTGETTSVRSIQPWAAAALAFHNSNINEPSTGNLTI